MESLMPQEPPAMLVLILPPPPLGRQNRTTNSCLPREQSHLCQVKLQCKRLRDRGCWRSRRGFHDNAVRDRLASSSRQTRHLEDWPSFDQERKGGKELPKVFQYSSQVRGIRRCELDVRDTPHMHCDLHKGTREALRHLTLGWA